MTDCDNGWIPCEGDEGVRSRRPCRACIAGYRHSEALLLQGRDVRDSEIADLRAKLAEAERERDEVRTDHKEAIEVLTKGGVALNVHSASSMVVHAAGIVGQVHDLVQRAKQAEEIQAMLTNHAKHSEAERVKATAACAEMRAALEMVAAANTRRLGESRRVIEATRALLSRTDLGRGWVVLEVVRRCRSVVEAHVRAYPKWTFRGVEQDPDGAHALLADLDALLGDEKGGVK